jgi:hypothetical protein
MLHLNYIVQGNEVLTLTGSEMVERMYGVVLWTDARDSKAVIWCEDQGNLAFYSEPGPEMAAGVTLDAGDLIQFDLREEAACRRAHNLQRVEPGHAPGLPASLRSKSTHADGSGDNVIAFPRR